MKITSEARALPRLYNTNSGGNPVLPNPDDPPPDPEDVDVALDSDAFVPIAPATSSGFVQEAHASTDDSDGNWNIVLDDPPTPGNVMVVGYTQRGWTGGINGDGTTIGVSTDWELIGVGTCGVFNGGSVGMWAKVVEFGDTGEFDVIKNASNAGGGWIAEYAMGELLDSDTDGPTAGSTSYTTPPLTATGVDQVMVAAIVQSSSSMSLTGDGTASLIATGPLQGGSVGPTYIGQYRIGGPGAEDIDASSSDGQAWGSVVALFDAVGTDIIWVPAPLTVDGDDATYDVSTLSEEVRIDLGLAQRLISARLLIGFDTSGSKTIHLWASNDPDMAGAVDITSEVLTATGGFTGDEVLFTIADTTPYRFWEFRGPTEDTRTYTVEMFAFHQSFDLGAYQLLSEKDQPNGYARLTADGLIPDAELADGTATAGYAPISNGDGTRTWSPVGAGTSIFINVVDYGATGDGTTDDTASIQAAIAAMVDGCTLFFPPASVYYKITDTLDIVASGCLILGSGSEYGSRVHMATTDTTAFSVIPSGLDGTRNQTNLIRGLLITGPGGNASGRGVYATSDVHLEDVGIAGFYDGLYWGSQTFYSRAFGCFFTDMQHAAVVMDATNNCTLDTCRITGDFGGGGLIGPVPIGVWIACPSTTGLANRIVNSSIEYFSGDGILLEGGSAVEIVGNYFETQQSSTGHAHIKFSSANTNHATRITSNYFQGDGTSGFVAIALDKCSDTVISSNRFGINGAIGITSTGNTTNVLLFGNYNDPAGTFSLPASSYILDPASPPGGGSFDVPDFTYDDVAVEGVATTAVRTDATLDVFDTTDPEALTFGGASAVGTAGKAARRDHVHGLPSGGGSGGQILVSDTPSTPLVFGDLIQNEAQDDLVYADS